MSHKTALVTGASRGIAGALARARARVAFNYADNAEAAEARTRGVCLMISGNVESIFTMTVSACFAPGHGVAPAN